MTKSPRLCKDDWLAAGFRALAVQGPSALRAEALARDIGTTKGSFYWHFKDLPDFKQQMLALWRSKVAGEIIADVVQEPTPQAQLRALVARAADPPPEEFGGAAIEPAVRAWSLTDRDVKASLADVDAMRLEFLRQLLADNGLDDPALADLFYGAYVGLDDLAAKGQVRTGPALQALLGLLQSDE